MPETQKSHTAPKNPEIVVRNLEKSQLKSDLPDFFPGDTIKVNVLIREGDRERVQAFQGICIGRSGGGLGETITVRKISFGVGVERTFLINSPRIQGIEVVRKAHVRRGKLYYLRNLVGKKATRLKAKKRIATVVAVAAPAATEATEEAATE